MMASVIAGTAAPQQDVLTVFLGDSRTVGISMCADENNNEVYIAKVGEGYKYLRDTAWDKCMGVVNEYPGKNIDIVVNFGVNDLGNESKYATFINEKAESLPDNVSLAYASVNPTCGTYERLSGQIQVFNESLKNDLCESIDWIDSNDYLTKNGYVSFDGLHYNEATNLMIHDYWVSELESQ